MNSSKTAVRSIRALRVAKPVHLRQHRFQSSSSTSSNASSHTHSRTALYGGLAGGAIAVIFGYGFYTFSGAKTAVTAAHQVKSYYESSKRQLQQAAPEPNEALDWLRKQAAFYAGFVPGGKQYVDSAFNDLDSIRSKHGDEVDKITRNAYEELKDVTKKDLSVQTATEAWQVLQKYVKQITDLVSDSAHEILDNHPQLKSAIGSNVDQLRSMGDKFGPEANKVVTDTWSQIRDIVAGGGLTAGAITKIKQLINEKTEQVKKFGDQAWTKGMDEVKPFLDKHPEVKDLLNSNKKDLLTNSDIWSKVKDAAQSGNTDDLQDFVKQSVDKVKNKSGDASALAEKYFDQVFPGSASQLMPELQKFGEMVKKGDTKGLEKLVKDTVDEIKQLLEKKIEEAKKILGGSDKDSK